MRTGFQFKKSVKVPFGKNKDYGTVILNLHVCLLTVLLHGAESFLRS